MVIAAYSCKMQVPSSSIKYVIEFNDSSGIAVGAGIGSLDLSVKGDCVVRTSLESAGSTNAQSVNFAFEKVENFQSLTEKLNVQASARVSGGVGRVLCPQ